MTKIGKGRLAGVGQPSLIKNNLFILKFYFLIKLLATPWSGQPNHANLTAHNRPRQPPLIKNNFVVLKFYFIIKLTKW